MTADIKEKQYYNHQVLKVQMKQSRLFASIEIAGKIQ